MADEYRWQVELERADVPALQTRLEWALQHQNRRFAEKWERAVPQEGMRRVLIAIAVIGLAIVVLGAALDPRVRDLRFVLGYGAIFAVVLILGIKFTPARKKAWQARSVGRQFARAAEGTYRPVSKQLPYTIDYRLAGDVVEARVDKLRLVRRTELGRVKLVLDAETVLFAFRRRGSFNPFRYIYVPTAADRAAVLAALARLGAEHVVLTGPIDGYVAPVPEARVRSS